MTDRYLSAERMTKDDFGRPFTFIPGELIYDAKTIQGPWATMTHESWKLYGLGRLGIGFGQKYERSEDGAQLLLVEGGVKKAHGLSK